MLRLPLARFSAADLLYAPAMVLAVAGVSVRVPLSVVPPSAFSVPLSRVIVPMAALMRLPLMAAVPDVMVKILLLMTSPSTVPVPPLTCMVPLLVMFCACVEPVISSRPLLMRVVLISVPVAVSVPTLLKATPSPKMARPVAGMVTVPPGRLLKADAAPVPWVNTALFMIQML